jgi:hypothetical protein
MRKQLPGVRSKPLQCFYLFYLELNFMNLQRISDFAENQGDRSFLFNKFQKSPEYLHAEVFT